MKFILSFAWLSFLLIYSVHAETINVVTEEMPPFNYTENGSITGFSTEIVREVLKNAGLTSDFKSYPWKRAYETALRSPNTLIYSIGRNSKRENQFKWVGSIAQVNIYFFKLKSRQDILIESFEEAKKYNIGVVNGDYTTDFLVSKNFEKLDRAYSYVLSVRKLFGGRIDLIIIDELALVSLVHEEAASGSLFFMSQLEKALFVDELSSTMYMAFSLKTPDSIVERSRKALFEVKKNGTFNKILKKYKN